MSPVSEQDVVRIVNTVLTKSGGARAVAETDQLSRLGIDSLAILNVILMAAEEFGLDLGSLDESMELPVTIRDVVTTLQGLQRANR